MFDSNNSIEVFVEVDLVYWELNVHELNGGTVSYLETKGRSIKDAITNAKIYVAFPNRKDITVTIADFGKKDYELIKTLISYEYAVNERKLKKKRCYAV
jgi:hypothetical protein